jgi:ADP-heptose:LPS heptosyltransferase
VAWSGNPLHDDDRRRSIPLDKFARLFGIPGVTVAILQKFRREADAAILAAHPSLDDRVRDASDFAATAAVVAGLDLVISIDSAVAHLAGTLGVPVWVLLPHTCDWRWDTGRADTPWYPSAKLYRQPRVGDWDSVLDEVARALHARAETAAGGGVA